MFFYLGVTKMSFSTFFGEKEKKMKEFFSDDSKKFKRPKMSGLKI